MGSINDKVSMGETVSAVLTNAKTGEQRVVGGMTGEQRVVGKKYKLEIRAIDRRTGEVIYTREIFTDLKVGE